MSDSWCKSIEQRNKRVSVCLSVWSCSSARSSLFYPVLHGLNGARLTGESRALALSLNLPTSFFLFLSLFSLSLSLSLSLLQIGRAHV